MLKSREAVVCRLVRGGIKIKLFPTIPLIDATDTSLHNHLSDCTMDCTMDTVQSTYLG